MSNELHGLPSLLGRLAVRIGELTEYQIAGKQAEMAAVARQLSEMACDIQVAAMAVQLDLIVAGMEEEPT